MAPKSVHPVLLLMRNKEEVESYEDCTIENTLIHRVWMRTNCLFRNVNTVSCLANNSQFFSCSINSTILNHCILFDCTWDKKTTLKHCQVITATLAFRRFPVEIRALIFEHGVEWTGRMPPLIVALRGDQQLYCEALEVFTKKNEFVYSGPDKEQKNLLAIARIHSLTIIDTFAVANFTSETKKFKNLRKLHISPMDCSALLGKVLPWWVNDLGTLEKLSIEVLDVAGSDGPLVVSIVNKSLGIDGSFIDRPPPIAAVQKSGVASRTRGATTARLHNAVLPTAFLAPSWKLGDYLKSGFWVRQTGPSLQSACRTYTWQAERARTLYWNAASEE